MLRGLVVVIHYAFVFLFFAFLNSCFRSALYNHDVILYLRVFYFI